MSDTGGGEANAARAFSIGAGVNLKLPEVDTARTAVTNLTAALQGLEAALNDFGNKSYNLADKINRNLKSIGDTATKVTGQMSGLSAAVAGAGGGTGGGGTAPAAAASPATGGGTEGGGGWATRAASSATAAIQSITDKRLPGGLNLGQFVGTGGGEGAAGFAKDLALSPLRYLRSRINTNRDTALMASGALNMASVQQGTTTGDMMSTIAKFPGSIYGTPQDMLELFASAPALGASYGFAGGGSPAGGQGVRAAGMLKGIREMQMLNPMASVGGSGGMVDTLGSYAGNTGAQQKSMMFTGGAMGMIAAGGRQKSLSEWAESILRWFEGLRPGNKRGKGFDYGELMAQYFPGSNIDAWFNVNQVPQNMRDYWWTYALGKAKKMPDTSSKYQYEVTPPEQGNVAWQRLKSGSELTRTEFSLAGQMSPQYAQRESSNRWFNELMGQVQSKIIPAISNSVFRWIQYLPDSVEDLMMTGAERGAGALFNGDVPNSGDVGDIGDSYGATGGTGLSGLHPDMKSKIGRMMKANPKLKVNSGLRDTGLQQKLRAAGNTNVSGKPSAHTRGMAADLGPKSQYGWIVKNAKRFGLASGIGHGEPWHVGMKGDIPGTGDVDVGDAFSDFINEVKGFGSSPEGMASLISKLINTMTGGLGKLLGAGEDPTDAFATSPDDLYTRLSRASQNTTVGINAKKTFDPFGPLSAGGGGGSDNIFGLGGPKTSSGQSASGTASGWGPNGKQWRGTSPSGRGDRYSMQASPDIMRDIGSSDPVTRGTAVARALSNAGFSGSALRNFLKISYRESHWTSNAWNSGPVDESGGILQANQLPWTKVGKPSPFTMADALDPQAAAYIAWDQYSNVAPMNGPGGPNTMKPWTINGNPFGGIPAEASGLTDQVLKQTGLGDIDAMKTNIALAGAARQGAGGITFNNEFKLTVPGNGGGSNGGIDVRRTVTLIADHLEDEMNRRLRRSA